MAKMTRKDYAALYGPTLGDGIRLGDTSLIAEIEAYASRMVARLRPSQPERVP